MGLVPQAKLVKVWSGVAGTVLNKVYQQNHLSTLPCELWGGVKNHVINNDYLLLTRFFTRTFGVIFFDAS